MFAQHVHSYWLKWLKCILLLVWICHVSAVIRKDVCIGDDFSASCRPNEVIVMETSELGRMEPGKCISAEKGNFGCKNDVLFLTDKWCSGRQSCEFYGLNRDLVEANSNCRDVVVYFTASFNCIPAFPIDAKDCNVYTLVKEHSVLSSHTNHATRCGSLKSPWIIQTKAGQTVEISLVDFKALDRARSHSIVACSDIYGFIVEKTLNINETICGQKTRETLIYRSKTNQLEIYMTRTTGASFILKYKAAGCSDPEAPDHGWYKRNGNEAVIGCDSSDKEWRLTCTGTKWQGEIGRCSAVAVSSEEEKTKDGMSFDFSTIVIVAGIIGGTIVLAVAVIVCGVVYIQKYRDRQEKKANDINQGLQSNPDKSESEQYRALSSNVVEGQDDYLEPKSPNNTQNRRMQHEEPLIHIWETPLPDPTNTHVDQSSRTCTIHRTVDGREKQLKSLSDGERALKDKPPVGSYYSPQTGHKYYVLGRDTKK